MPLVSGPLFDSRTASEGMSDSSARPGNRYCPCDVVYRALLVESHICPMLTSDTGASLTNSPSLPRKSPTMLMLTSAPFAVTTDRAHVGRRMLRSA